MYRGLCTNHAIVGGRVLPQKNHILLLILFTSSPHLGGSWNLITSAGRFLDTRNRMPSSFAIRMWNKGT